jgi:uncharacterized DUF497 family protein
MWKYRIIGSSAGLFYLTTDSEVDPRYKTVGPFGTRRSAEGFRRRLEFEGTRIIDARPAAPKQEAREER